MSYYDMEHNLAENSYVMYHCINNFDTTTKPSKSGMGPSARQEPQTTHRAQSM